MEQTDARPVPATRVRGLSSGLMLVVGVLLIPLALTLAFNSWTPPDAQDYVRMAFAQVAGSVIGMATAVGLVIHRILRRSPPSDIIWFGAIAIVIVAWQISALSAAADLLLQRLSLAA